MSHEHADPSSATQRAALVAGWKRQAGEAAAALVESGMTVGLGTGSTAYWAIAAIGRRLREGELHDLRAVATSEASARQAHELEIPLATLADAPRLDLAIDGADEIAPDLGLVKGGGGALVREKIVAGLAERFVVVGDQSKRVRTLGSTFALPVAVVPFGWPSARALLRSHGAQASLRTDDAEQPWVSDDGLFVLDARFDGGIADPQRLEAHLEADPSVVCCGLFLGLAHQAFVGGSAGLEILPRATGA